MLKEITDTITKGMEAPLILTKSLRLGSDLNTLWSWSTGVLASSSFIISIHRFSASQNASAMPSLEKINRVPQYLIAMNK